MVQPEMGEYDSELNLTEPKDDVIQLGQPVYTDEQQLALQVMDETLADPGAVIPSVYSSDIQVTEVGAYPIALTRESFHPNQIYYPFHSTPIIHPEDGSRHGFLTMVVSGDQHWLGVLENNDGQVLFADDTKQEELTFFNLAVLKGIPIAEKAFQSGNDPLMIAEIRSQERVSAIRALSEAVQSGLAVQPEIIQLIREGKLVHDWKIGLSLRHPLDFALSGDFWKTAFNKFEFKTGLSGELGVNRNSGIPNRSMSAVFEQPESQYVNRNDVIVPMSERTRIMRFGATHVITGPALCVSVHQEFRVGKSTITINGSSSTR